MTDRNLSLNLGSYSSTFMLCSGQGVIVIIVVNTHFWSEIAMGFEGKKLGHYWVHIYLVGVSLHMAKMFTQAESG